MTISPDNSDLTSIPNLPGRWDFGGGGIFDPSSPDRVLVVFYLDRARALSTLTP